MKEKILDNITEPLKEIGVSVYEITFGTEDGVDTLFIKLTSDEKEIDTNTCEEAASIINPIIDELDIDELKGEYVLDICSKGEYDE